MQASLMASAGPLTFAAGALWMAASLGHVAVLTGLVRDEALLGLVAIPVLVSFVPLLGALVGTWLRFFRSVNAAGRLGLAGSVLGCAGVVAFLVASLATGAGEPESDRFGWANVAAVGCLLGVRVGYVLFGVGVLADRPLPWGNALPLLAGSTVVLGLPFEWFGVPALLPLPWGIPVLGFLHFAATGACWLLLGVAMTDRKREPRATEAI